MYRLILLIIVLIIYYFWKDKSNVPHPCSLPIIGNMYLFFFTKKVFTGTMFELVKKSPGICKVSILSPRCYFITNPDYLQIIMNDKRILNKADFYGVIRSMIGDSVFTVDVPFWKSHRRIIQSRFSQRILNNFVEKIMIRSHELVDVLKKYTDGQTHDLTLPIHVCNIKSICDTQFGVEMDDESIEIIYEVIEKLTQLSFKLITNGYLRYDWIFRLTKYHQIQIDGVAEIEKVAKKLIDHKLNERAKKIGRKNPETVLDLLVDLMAENKIDQKQIDAEFDIMLIAGYDTSAKMMTFLFVTLGLNQDVQDKIYEEIMEVLGNRDLTHDDLPKMKYTECVIKETLRLFPVAHTIARYLPNSISLGKYNLPAGSTLLLGLYALHRDPLYWENPLKFDPDRFLPENVKDRHPYAFVPFSGGSRNCLGATYAMMSLKCMTIDVIKNFKIRTTYKSIEDLNLCELVVLSLNEGTKTILELRN